MFPELTVNDGSPIRGVDISSIIAIENAGVVFRDGNGNVQDIFTTLKQNGVNYIRVRVWNDPRNSAGRTYGGGNNDVQVAAQIGKRAAEHGMKLLVNFHYSDFWADPGKQTPPKAWTNFTLSQLETAIYDFTLASLNTIKSAGADIGMVQIGNETNFVMCGRTGMNDLARMMNAGSRAVRELDSSLLVAVHFTNPSLGNGQTLIWYAQELHRLNVDYDVYMTSYYSFWHGTIANLTNVLNTIATQYGKYVVVGEMAHPYTNAPGDGFGHEVTSSSSGVDLRYPVSPQGQIDMMTDVYTALAGINGGIGAFYWEPAWLGVMGLTHQQRVSRWETHGSGWATHWAGEFDHEAQQYGTGGSSYQNQALFDFHGNPLPSLSFFNRVRALNEPTQPTLTFEERFPGVLKDVINSTKFSVNYSPHTHGFSPWNPPPTSLIREHLEMLSHNFDSIRLFTAGDDMLAMYDIAHELGFRVIGTAWIDGGMTETAIYRQLDNLIALSNAGKVTIASVGSEVLFRNDKTPAQMLVYMNYVKERITAPVPVTYMDTTAVFNGGQDATRAGLTALNAACDLILFSHYPFFSWNYNTPSIINGNGGVIPYAIAELRNAFRDVKNAQGGKPVILAETGWATAGDFWYGDARPTPENSRAYWDVVQAWAKTENVDVYWFAFADELWKPNAGDFNERNWGIWDSEGKIKDVFSFLDTPQKLYVSDVNANRIELTNPTNRAISTRGMYLSDKQNKEDVEADGLPTWQMPVFIIPAGGSISIRLNSNTSSGLKRARANFDLEAGGTVYLINVSDIN
jgi:arabinogalactan endo-1,4-beta-galactosidase